MTSSTEIVQVETGEIVHRVAQLTPKEAGERARWVREVTKAALAEGVDYGIIPGTGTKPTLLKPGAEMLLLAAGLGFTNDRIDDDDSRNHQGVTYKCTIRRGDTIVASCDGYAGYDESRFQRRNGVADWNSVVKMAQKRALVGAALNAVAGSGLFTADLEDEPPAPSAALGEVPAAGGSQSAQQSPGRRPTASRPPPKAPPSRRPPARDAPPPDYYDNLPESRGYDPEIQPASYENPAR